MLTIKNLISTKAEYESIKADWIIKAEGYDSGIYIDSHGVVTIGIGWNLSTDQHVREFLLSENGLNIQPLIDNETLSLNDFNSMVQQILTYTSTTYAASAGGGSIGTETTTEANLQANLNAILDAYLPSAGNVFEFSSQTNAKIFLQDTGDDYEDQLMVRLVSLGVLTQTQVDTLPDNGFAWSYERLALWDLAFNGGATEMIGNGLGAALVSGNRFDAWFEIRYNSNGGVNKSGGLAKRRFAESAMFGLYDDRPIESQATDIIAKLVSLVPVGVNALTEYGSGGMTYLELMLAYERHEGSATYWKYATYNKEHTSGSNAEAEFDYAGPIDQFKDMLAFQDIFKPIAGYLINYFDGDASTAIGDAFGLNFNINGEVVLGLEIHEADIIKSVAVDDGDTQAENNNDLLINVKNEAKTLMGGKGDDVLIGNDSVDTLIGGEGNDYLIGRDGADIYTFDATTNFGHDIIAGDTDGGTINITGLPSGTIQAAAPGSNVYVFVDGNGKRITTGEEVKWSFVLNGTTLRIIFKEEVAGEPVAKTITVENFNIEGTAQERFGLTLLDHDGAPITTDPVAASTGIIGDGTGASGVPLISSTEQARADDTAQNSLNAQTLDYVAADYYNAYDANRDGNDEPYDLNGNTTIENSETPTLMSYRFSGGSQADVLKGKDWEAEQNAIAADAHQNGYQTKWSNITESPFELFGDVLNGKDGNDVIYGDGKNGSAPEQITGDEDILIGGKGSDVIYGGGGADFIIGRDEFSVPDWVDGTPLADGLENAGDSDYLDGGAGNDLITSGNYSDVLIGGADDSNEATGVASIYTPLHEWRGCREAAGEEEWLKAA